MRVRSVDSSLRRAMGHILALLPVFAFLALSHPLPTRAHEIRPTIATLELAGDGSFTLDLAVNLEALIAAVGPEHQDSATSPNAAEYDRLRALPPDALREAYGSFAGRLGDGVTLADNRGNRAALRQEGIDIPAAGDTSIQRTSTVSFSGQVPEGATSLRWRFDEAFGPSVIRVRPAGGGDVVDSDYVVGGETSDEFAVGAIVRQGSLSVFIDYLRIGFEHIVPKGLDHILFVVGLFLLSPRMTPILWQVTCFTVAHSVTLALGMLGLVTIPPWIVEPLIALSIVYVAVENIRSERLSHWRPLVVFGFGLLHGLGFAGVLAEVGLAPGHFVVGLIAFNIGVELGQIAVVAGCFLAVGLWFGGRSWYRSAVTVPASVAIAAIATYWFIERIAWA